VDFAIVKEFSPWVADRLLTANVGRKGPDKTIVHPRQAGEYARVQSVVLSTAGANQVDLPCIRHNHFVPQTAQQAAHPRRVPSHFRGDPVPSHGAEHLHHPLLARWYATFFSYFAAAV